jgi:ABC-2 type transport system permease protein
MMKSLVSLVHREYLEHKGAFLFAPAILLVLFAVTFGGSLIFNDHRLPFAVDADMALRFFKLGLLGLGGLWCAYIMVALFFYFADAFNADRRSNSMLFWKSMPQSDFKVLMSKMLAGLTLLPGLVFVVFIVTGIVLYGMVALAVTALPLLEVPSIGAIAAASVEMWTVILVYLALALLWYAPFFAWVGGLSTMVGRWSIPLAFLIPGLLVLGENFFVRGLAGMIGGLIAPSDVPRGGYILEFLRQRSQFGVDNGQFENAFVRQAPIDGWSMITEQVLAIDWTQMAAGLIFAAVAVWLASEYRRRFVVA